MIEFQRIVDEIDTILRSKGPDREVAADVASRYSSACAMANERLLHCGDLLRRGLRSEAIQAADQDPNLVELVALLDFERLERWQACLEHWEMELPRPLNFDMASALNEAYAEEEPLQALLKSHRLLALGRGLLKVRIGVLRKIHLLDVNNLAWLEDLQIYEAERIRQVGAEAQDAAKRNDLDALKLILAEVNGPGWIEPVPPHVVRNIEHCFARVSQTSARAELPVLADRFAAAWKSANINEARRLRKAWQQLIAVAQPDQETLAVANEALAWLEDEDHGDEVATRQAATIAELSKALSASATLDELGQLHHAVVASAAQLPPEMQQQYDGVFNSSRHLARRKRLIRITSVATAVLLLALCIFFVVQYVGHENVVALEASHLEELLENGKVDEAQQYLTGLEEDSPSVASSPAIKRISVRLSTLFDERRQKSIDFQNAFSALVDSGHERPDPTALSQARSAACTASEKSMLEDFKDKIKQSQGVRDKLFLEGLAKIAEEIDRFDLNSTMDLDVMNVKVQSFQRRLDALPHDKPVAKELLAKKQPFDRKLDGILEDLELNKRRSSDRKAVTQAIGDPQRYRNALLEFAQEFPDSRAARDLEVVAAEIAIWTMVDQWIDLLSAPAYQSPETITSAMAKTLLSEGNKLLEETGETSMAEAYLDRRPYLEQLAARQSGRSSLLTDYVDKNVGPLESESWLVVVRLKDRQESYYLPEKPDLENDIVTLNYYSDMSLTIDRQKVARESVQAPVHAPHVQLISQAKTDFKSLPDAEWESKFLSLIEEIYRHESMSPIWQVLLLDDFIKLGCAGSYCLAKPFKGHLDLLQEEIKEINVREPWLAPRNLAGIEVRNRAKIALQRFSALKPSFDDAKEETLRLLAEFHEPVKTDLQWIGWLGRRFDDSWHCYRPNAESYSGELVVIHPQPDSKNSSMTKVARMKNGLVTFAAPTDHAFLEGRPVYLRSE